jgi:hypothetical protein
MSDKMGQFLQHTATFVAGYVLAFIKGWVRGLGVRWGVASELGAGLRARPL